MRLGGTFLRVFFEPEELAKEWNFVNFRMLTTSDSYWDDERVDVDYRDPEVDGREPVA